MKLNQKQRQLLLRKHCGVINSDDAIEPKHYFYNKRKAKSKYRKVYQLCRQVLQTLQLVLVDDVELLQGVSVVDVVPAPDSRRLLVIVSLDTPIDSSSLVESVMVSLKNQVPRLRCEIARSVHRRKTPNLVFEIAKLKPAGKTD